MYFFIIFITLVILGITDSVYLIWKNRGGQPLVCPLNGNCHAVLASKWNRFLGVKNEIWGLLYYLGVLTLLGLVFYGFIEVIILFGVISFGILYSSFLTGIQVFVLKEYCFYCLVSAIINLLLFISIIIYI